MDVTVVGGGLAGLTIGSLLARAGYAVTVLEASGDFGRSQLGQPRSINLALSARGFSALSELGLARQVEAYLVPMFGRRIHAAPGICEFQAYDLVGRQAIYSIRRSILWQLLRETATAAGVTLQFDRNCHRIDFAGRRVELVDVEGRHFVHDYGALIGADGARSEVRRALAAHTGAANELASLRHGYKELHIPRDLASDLDFNALHSWPQGDLLLIALPNTDGSFTATLFVPLQGAFAEKLRKPDGLAAVFEDEFPEAAAMIPNYSAALAENPLGYMHTVKCGRWSDGDRALLIGDAAHAMAPFYGQGMNCALEDCTVLMRAIERHGGRWPDVFNDFERERRPNTDAISALSEANYTEMSERVTEGDFRLRLETERALQQRYARHFTPLYAMVAFSTRPYAEALARSLSQQAIVDRLSRGVRRIEDIDFALAESLLLETARLDGRTPAMSA